MGQYEDCKRWKGNPGIPRGMINFKILYMLCPDKSSQALQVYSKAVPLSTYADIEKKMREEDFKIHLIALVSWQQYYPNF